MTARIRSVPHQSASHWLCVRTRGWPPSNSTTPATSSAASGWWPNWSHSWWDRHCSRSSVRRAAASPRSCARGFFPRSRGRRFRAAQVARRLHTPRRASAARTPERDRLGRARPRDRRRSVRGDLHALPRLQRAAGVPRRARRLSRDPAARFVVVLTLRADLYGRCATHAEFAALLTATPVLVGPLRREELRSAITRPADRAGLRVEPELVDALLSDVESQPGALPLLSAALLELWRRRDGDTLRLRRGARRRRLGVVARWAEAAFARCPWRSSATRSRVPAACRRRGLDGRRPPLPARRVRGERAGGVVDRLAAARLLTIADDTVEVAHEALLREWPRLRGWLEEDAQGRRIHRHLSVAARDWLERGREPSDLYRGARLAGRAGVARRARDGSQRARTDVPGRRGRGAGRRARNGEAANAASAGTRRRTGGTRGGRRRLGHHRHRPGAARQRRDANRDLAELRDAGGLPARHGSRRGGALERRGVPDGTDHRGEERGSDRRLAARASRGSLPADAAETADLAFAPDGRTIAVAHQSAGVRLWDVRTRRPLGPPLDDRGGPAARVAFSPDGSTLVVAGVGGLTRWDVAQRRNPARRDLIVSRRARPWRSPCSRPGVSRSLPTAERSWSRPGRR